MTARRLGPFIAAFILTAFLIFIFWLVAAVPQQNRANSLEAERVSQDQTNSELESRRDDLRDKREHLADIRADANKLTESFPQSADQKDLYEAIMGAAAQSGVTVTTLNPGTPVASTVNSEETAEDMALRLEAEAQAAQDAAAEGVVVAPPTSTVATVPLTIEATGSVADLRAFLSALEELKRPLTMETVKIGTEGESTTLTVTANSFFVSPLVDPEATDKDTAAAPSAPAAEPSPTAVPTEEPAVSEDEQAEQEPESEDAAAEESDQ